MDLVKHADQSLFQANLRVSKMDEKAFAVAGMTSPKIRHLLNNLGSLDDLTYLEIGVHKGGTFVAAMYKNNMLGYGVDNWCEFSQDGLSRSEFIDNCQKLLSNYEVIEQDCFALTKADFKRPINFYLYDGCHSYDSQYKALTHYYDMLADEFIFVVDDFDWGDTSKATKNVIADLGLEVKYERKLKSRFDGDIEEWWNGLYLSVLKKKETNV